MEGETEEQYLAHRDHEEWLLLRSSSSSAIIEAHCALARKYRAKLESLPTHANDEKTKLITTPLSVDTVDGEVVPDGQLSVAAALAADAAIETGVLLIQAALDLGPAHQTRK